MDADPNFVVSVDVNGDFFLDIVTANRDDEGGTGGSVSVLLNSPPQDRVIGDITGDGVVDVADLITLLANWGECPPLDCLADLNFDGVVDVADLILLLSNWS